MVTHYLAKFSGYMHCASGDIMVLVCYVILQDLECKSHMILWERAPQCKSTPCQV